MRFDQLKIKDELVKNLENEGILEATQIQQDVIPKILERQNIAASSQTGSGKTIGFLLPLVQLLDQSKKEQALILCPTRELAQQVGKVFEKLTNKSACVIYGGVEYKEQIEAINSDSSIIIGTAGRVLDLVQQGVLVFKNLNYFVLDEVDQMLGLGFYDSIITLSKLRSAEAQTICLSATLTKNAIELLDNITSNIIIVNKETKLRANEDIEQYGYIVEMPMMDHLLIHIIRSNKIGQGIIFTRSKKMADIVAKKLLENGLKSEAIHSDKSQAAREYILDRFKNNETSYLVATDVIARGIDIDNIEYVINYGLPLEAEQYIHRIGRTGRAGNKGVAISLSPLEEKPLLDKICILMKKNIPMQVEHPYKMSPKHNKKKTGFRNI